MNDHRDSVYVNIRKSAFMSETDVNWAKIESKFSEFEIKDIRVLDWEDKIELELKRQDYSYCEDLQPGLDLLSIRKGNIKDYCVITDNNCLCLSECWLPYAWSCIRSREVTPLKHLTILHIDDHSDLMSPFISYDKDWSFDLLTGKEVSFADPYTIKSAVQSGAITIGSMLTPIARSAEITRVLHLKQRVDQKRESHFTFVPKYDEDFYEPVRRAVLNYSQPELSSDNLYVRSSKIEELLPYIGKDETLILHIDMDYFNNRYNGSTDWTECDQHIDINMAKQKEMMLSLCHALGRLNQLHRIENVLIGISPSFYPVEYWKDGLHYLFKQLNANGIMVNDLNSLIV